MDFFTERDAEALPDFVFEEPAGYEIVGYWCWRSGGHVCNEACKSDSVPLFAQVGWADGVRRNLEDQSAARDQAT